MSKRKSELNAKHVQGIKKKGKDGTRSTTQPQGFVNTDRVKGTNFHRSKQTQRRLDMYNAKPNREKMREAPAEAVVRIEPGRKWFNNTRVVSQDKLESFRDALVAQKKDPRSILLKKTKLPLSLFDHSSEAERVRATNVLSVEPYEETFSARRRMKRPHLAADDLAAFASAAHANTAGYKAAEDKSLVAELVDEQLEAPVEAVMLKGTSKRIWGELYKVVDSSDVIVEVLDARDPLGTRAYHLERHIKKDRPFKHIVLVLNKCDLIPTDVTEKWLRILGKEFPTVAFKANMKHPLGKKSLIGLLRQFGSHLEQKRKHVSVGFVGFPNVGKSSVINTLKGKKVCDAAPVPGETKIWRYVQLTTRVYLIDCPGIVTSSIETGPDSAVAEDEDGDVVKGEAEDVMDVAESKSAFGKDECLMKVLRGVVRAEKLESPEAYIEQIIAVVGKEKIDRKYKVTEPWETAAQLLDLLAAAWGKLGKGGVPHHSQVAVRIIFDLQRGKLPYFVPPPSSSASAEKRAEKKAEKKAEKEAEKTAENSD